MNHEPSPSLHGGEISGLLSALRAHVHMHTHTDTPKECVKNVMG